MRYAGRMRLVYAFLTLAAASCLPAAESPPHCQEGPLDVAIAAVLAECRAEIAAEASATGKSRLRAECLGRLDELERSCK